MNGIAVLGHFAYGQNKVNGQTIKTQEVTQALREHFTANHVHTIDTCGGWRFLLKLPFVAARTLSRHRHVVMMPAQRGIFTIVPIFLLLNMFFRRTIHYVVIGGWLPAYARRSSFLRSLLRDLDHIYVETLMMKRAMDAMSFTNTYVMPNCKNLDIADDNAHNVQATPPYLLCTFSRVTKEKGIEDAISAVNDCNRRLGKVTFHLHIYGQIEQPTWFHNLMAGQSSEIQYKGLIAYNKSTQVLKQYLALLFPTFYHGEAFAGTLIDAMAAGLPVIASDWHANSELVLPDRTGILFPAHSVEALTEILLKVSQQPMTLNMMRRHCLKRAHNYLPETALRPLFNNIAYT